MRTHLWFGCILVLLLGLLAQVHGLETSENISSYGIVHVPAPALRRFADGATFEAIVDPVMIASLFDMCSSTFWYGQRVQQVHQIRPSFKALLYRNIRDVYNYSAEWQKTLESNWILKAANGQLVHSVDYPTDFFADIGNPDYQKWVANWIKDNIYLYGYDGVCADYGLASWQSEFFWGASAEPLNPRTGVAWTNEEFSQALIQLDTEIKGTIGTAKLLVCNGIWEGDRFWERYDAYMDVLSNSPLDGLVSEALWYSYQGIWWSEAEWLKSLDFFLFIQDNYTSKNPERVFIPACNLGGLLPADCSREQMLLYGFASTLLGIRNSQNYLYMKAEPNFTAQMIQPLFSLNVGSPLNNYYMVAGTHVYARDFSNAKVLVNPTSNSYVVDLNESFRTLEGTIITEITMEAHTGVILKA